MTKGIWYAIGAYVAWGLFPVFWAPFNDVPALQVLCHRIFWSFLLLVGWNLVTGQWKAFTSLALNRRILGIYTLAAVLIAITWLTFIWAVGAGFVVEISLGYFINPLLSVFLGVVFMRERLRPLQWVPIGLAATGVLYLTLAYGALPWIALTLAFTFGLYGLVKKVAPLSSMTGMTIETGILFLPAFGYLVYSELGSQGAFLHMTAVVRLELIGTSLLTIIPLLMFSSAAQTVPLSTIGVLQYFEPTLQFILGVLLFHEPFSIHRLLGFAVVWVAILLFATEGLVVHRRHTALDP